LEIAFADCSGWDTHVNQGSSEGQLAARLRELGLALAAFNRDLGDRMRNIVVLTMSEFRPHYPGERQQRHRSRPRDRHARARRAGERRPSAGRWPGLGSEQRFEGRDVAVTTDFRDLFGEILTRHLGATDLGTVFPGYVTSAARFLGAIRG